jgi:aspartyl-tRNA(Asn)/glutamyl-tRNA(Gln) amidotransferase subunit A
MGSDTGGSIRIPASFCGLVGHKPTYGVVSRYGVSPLAWSLDHCGPMTRTVMDSALAMNAIAGHDPKDPASSSVPPPDYTASIKEGIKGLRIGVPKEYFEVLLDPEIKDTVLKALDLLQELGAEVREISWPNFQRGVAMAHLISIAEASNIHSGLARTHDSPEVSEVLREFPRIEAGMTISAADYLKIQQLRARYTAESHKLMEDVDLLAGPTMPMTTFPLGSPKIQLAGETVVPDTAIPTYTRPFDFNGFPAVTVPCGFSVGGLPIGLQLAGRPHEDATVLRAAYAYEQATNWHTRKPSL